jgi:Tol biopolymer transport system component
VAISIGSASASDWTTAGPTGRREHLAIADPLNGVETEAINPRLMSMPFARIFVAWLGALVMLSGCSKEAAVTGAESDGLVFVRQTDQGTDLFRARLADGAVEQVTHTRDRNENWPSWSAPARRLAFLTDPGEDRPTWDLLVWSPADPDQASVYASGQTEYFLDWSPTTPTLAYSHRTSEGVYVVAQVDVESNVRSVLAEAIGGGFLVRPSFAFDGKRMLAQRLLPGGASQLLILEPGRELRRLTGAEPLYDDHGRFTRDDEWVVFDRRDTRAAPADLMLIRPDGSDTRNLTNSETHDDHSPRASPVRNEIVFASDRSGVNDLYIVDYPDGAVRRLTDTPDVGEWMPQFSPDGERIVYMILPADFRVNQDALDPARARIGVVDRNGRPLFETNGINPDWMPAWP